jgi:Hemerythrin HHE cation binding domain
MSKAQFKGDPASPEFKISDEFLPDKEHTWHFPPENDGWVLAHKALRGEIQMIKEALQAVQERQKELQVWEIKAINGALNIHLKNVHSHHAVEDEIYAPELRKRFRYPEQLTAEHSVLDNMLGDIEKTFHSLIPGDKVDTCLIEWEKYQDYMLPHLAQEEEVALPLFRAYFTPADVRPIDAKIVERITKEQTGSLIFFCGTKYWRNDFMVQEKIPWVVSYIYFQFQYTWFTKVFVGNLKAVKTGTEPQALLSWFFGSNRA